MRWAEAGPALAQACRSILESELAGQLHFAGVPERHIAVRRVDERSKIRICHRGIREQQPAVGRVWMRPALSPPVSFLNTSKVFPAKSRQMDRSCDFGGTVMGPQSDLRSRSLFSSFIRSCCGRPRDDRRGTAPFTNLTPSMNASLRWYRRVRPCSTRVPKSRTGGFR